MNENTFVDSFFYCFNLFVSLFFSSVCFFCFLSHFEINKCSVKSLITILTYFLLKYNWKKKTRKVFFGHYSLSAQTGIPVSQTAWIRHWIESLSHFFLHCHHFMNICATLLDDLQFFRQWISGFTSLFYEKPNFNPNQNNKILSSISFIIKSEKFSGLLFRRNLKYIDYKTSNSHSYLISQF